LIAAGDRIEPMNAIPGSAFFKTVSGSAGQAASPRPIPATNAALQAQTAESGRRAGSATNEAGSPPPAPFGPRGSIIDIIA
jgi:hypothetical protein